MLPQVIEIAKSAGNIILRHYNKDPSNSVQYKSDDSPLTLADMESHTYIVSELDEKFSYPIISEESPVDHAERKTWDEFWLVDPLDGTKDFLEKNGEFTVNISLIKGDIPVLGVIYCPAIRELYYSEKGDGAYKEKDGIVTRLSCDDGGNKIIATGSRQHASSLDQEFYKLNRIERVIPHGSSRKFCAVASGEVTIYPRFQGSMEWDITAGHIIAKEAGCKIVDLKTGKEPRYNKETLKNNHFVVHAPWIILSNLIFPDEDDLNPIFHKK